LPSVNANPPTLGQITDDPRYNERNGLGHVLWSPVSANLWMISGDPTAGAPNPLLSIGAVGDFAFRKDGAGATSRLYVRVNPAPQAWTLVI
jgi:hypothetical protein